MIKISKIPRIIERKLWFYIFQLIALVISVIIVLGGFFTNADMVLKENLMDWRNTILSYNENINNFQKNKNIITVVGVDERFFQKEQISIQWLHRWYYAQAIENLNEFWAKSIWVDVFFEELYDFGTWGKNQETITNIFREFDMELAESINEKVTLAATYSSSEELINLPHEEFLKNNPGVWHVESFTDRYSGKNIGVQPFVEDDEKKIKPLWIETYLNYINQKSENKWIEAAPNIVDDYLVINTLDKNLQIPISSQEREKNEQFIFTPIYETSRYSQRQIFNYISLYDLINSPERYKNFIEDNIVLIWATDPTLQDIHNFLTDSSAPWVYMHANSVLSMLQQDFLYIPDKEETLIIIVMIFIINALIFVNVRKEKFQKIVVYLLFSEIVLIIILWYFLGVLYWLDSANSSSVFLPFFTILSSVLSQFILAESHYLIETTALKENFRKLFGLYVWEKISEKTEKDIDDIWEKQAEEKEIAMFFSDIEGFTELSEKLPPQDNVEVLNKFLEDMSYSISSNKWFIDKYIWDAIMAFREGENSSELSARAAVGNILTLDETNKQLKNYNISEEIKMNERIWLHYWKAIVGDIWARDFKLNYTIIWDNVNLAARLEWVNKFYWTNICASQDIIDNLQENTEILYRKLDKIIVKWKSKSLTIYEIIPVYKSNLSEDELNFYKNYINTFEEGLNKYLEWNFEEAIKIFNKVQEIKQNKATEIFLERCEILIQNPPETWDGTWTFKEK